jgi:hypothetical protein
MTKAPVPFRGGSGGPLSVVSVLFVIAGYALAGFGAVLILDGGIRAVTMVHRHGVLVAPRSFSVDFITALSLVVAGVVVFVVGRLFASIASSRAR